MKYGEAQPLVDRYYSGIEQEIRDLFAHIIYGPLGKTINEQIGAELRNASSPLIDAIHAGIIWYDSGEFRGSFNSKTTKALKEAGANWNTASRTFSLPWNDMPMELRTAQAHAEMNYDALRKSVIKSLDNMDIDSINHISDVSGKYFDAVTMINEDWEKKVKSISIPPNLTDQQKNIIAAEWGQNLDKYIKKWTADNILSLREAVYNNTFGGRTTKSLIEHIQENYEISKRKAKFLARQETSLLLSKFHETRYADIGVTEYKWSGTMDARERPDHKALQGQIFRFDSPPVVDLRTGRRANPGEDYGCRCKAIPVIR